MPKALAAVACALTLGAQLRASLPISRVTNGWYWPFLSYPMYAIAHDRRDSLLVAELRVTTCASPAITTVASGDSLGVPSAELNTTLTAIAREPSARGERAVTRVVDAQFPGRYCGASVWTRTVLVSDTATHHLRVPMRRAAAWPLGDASRP
ncbi:MAG: hypothetical protein ACREMU_01740 [Gemmatimonadaceae bacterium]